MRISWFCILYTILSTCSIISAQPFPTPNDKGGLEDNEPYVFDYNKQWEGIYDSLIHTLTFRSLQDWYSYPILDLNYQKSYLIEFDDFRTYPVSYNYRLVHCNHDWTPSELEPIDFMNGYTEGEVDDYFYANTEGRPYIHYSLLFPRADSYILASGNYEIQIFNYDDPDVPVLIKRLVVIDNQLDFKTQKVIPAYSRYRRAYQSLEFSLNYTDADITQPMRDIKASILQNGRWDNAIIGLAPTYFDMNNCYYNYRDQNFFKGGKEFRYIDLINLENPDDNIEKIDFSEPGHPVVRMKTDDTVTYQSHTMKRDLNGRFYIGKKQRFLDMKDETYLKVDFSLAIAKPFTDSNVYIRGELSSWCIQDEYKMHYNPLSKKYEVSLFLKQGIYNYQYVLNRDGSNEVDDTSLEGSYWNTENDYLVIIYYRPFNARYDHAIGFTKINSYDP